MPKPSRPSVAFAHLGCEKNRVDTEHMLGLLAEAGYTVSADENQASVVVVNTCSFIQDARTESVRTLVELAEQGKELIIAGCLAYLGVLVLALLPLVLRGEARSAVAEPSWWGLLLLSTGMAVFSLLLMGVMVFKIQAICAFCILSALLSLALFVLALIGGEWQDRGQLIFRSVLVGLAVMLLGLGWATAVDRPADLGKGAPIPVTRPSTPATLALAEHLTASGARMYSAYWCPHCHEQKEMFGKEAAARLTVIECAPDGRNSQSALCESKKIQGYPTWEINGQIDSGVKSLPELALRSGFKGKL